MDVEYKMHMSKNTWDLVPEKPGMNMIDCMWVYNIKWDSDGNWVQDKARLVGKGYTQQLGIDYNETWAVVMKLESVQMMAAIVASMYLYL